MMIPFNDKAGYDMRLYLETSRESMKAAADRLVELNRQGPKGWRLIEATK